MAANSAKSRVIPRLNRYSTQDDRGRMMCRYNPQRADVFAHDRVVGLCGLRYHPVIWLVIHPRADCWRLRKGSPYRVLVPMWIGMWIAAGILTASWRELALYQTAWTWLPALVLFAAGFWIYRLAGAGFSASQLGGLPELIPGHREQRLATSGIRARVRHPVYLGHLCEMMAWSLGSGLVVCYGLTLFAVVTGAFMIRLEDRELESRFGQDYGKYRENVPAILPRMLTR
jgi:protein-S-isoprenylcysteine O-methyltransferase Ste14